MHALKTAKVLNESVKASQFNKSSIHPIRVAPKSRKMTASLKRKRQHYVSPLLDDRGHTSPQEDWGSILS